MSGLGWILRYPAGVWKLLVGDGKPSHKMNLDIWDPFFISSHQPSHFIGAATKAKKKEWLSRTQSEWSRLPASPVCFHCPALPPKLWNKCLGALNRHLQFIIIVETVSLHCFSTWSQQQAQCQWKSHSWLSANVFLRRLDPGCPRPEW